MRKLSILLVIGMALSLIAGCSSGETDYSEEEFATVDNPVEVIDPKEIPDDLIAFLDWFGWYSLSGNNVFDSENINEESNVMNFAFTHCVNFDLYPGDTASRFQKDPSGRFDYCDIYEESKVDWILQTIFHYSKEDIEWIKSTSSDEYYINEGYYYVKTGGLGGGFDAKPLYVEKDGDKLKLTFVLYQGDVLLTLAGIRYAVVSKDEDYWTLHYWSSDVPSNSVKTDVEIEGNWGVEGDPSKSLVIEKETGNGIPIHVTLEKGAGFSADAIMQSDGKHAVFSDINSNYSGWLEFTEDSVILHVCTDKMDMQTIEFKKSNSDAPSEKADDFMISPSELEDWIAFIRACYYTPGDLDTKIVLENGTDGWNYSREYYYHDGQFIFAFIYNGTEEHRLYFKDNHMIRYIDERHTTFDFPNLDAFQDWEQRALEEALKNISVDISAWKGTWKAENGEWIDINEVNNEGFKMTYNGYKADGTSMFHADHTLVFTDASHIKASETAQSMSDMGWGYSTTLSGNTMILSSRYPDKAFYRQ